MKKIQFIPTKSVFVISILVIVLTIIGTWLFGIGKHHNMFENSILSTSIISTTFLLFITIGLYQGYKLKHNVNFHKGGTRDSVVSDYAAFGEGFGEIIGASAEGGIGGIVIGILLWLLMSILIILFVSIIGPLLWSSILAFGSMLYWIFYRALRLIFKQSYKCQGNFTLSLMYGFYYTILYNVWIYGIILGVHYFNY